MDKVQSPPLTAMWMYSDSNYLQKICFKLVLNKYFFFEMYLNFINVQQDQIQNG